MKKEKVFIVVFHKHQLKPKSNGEWQVAESVEFVSELRRKHYEMSSAIGDYINRRMITGARFGMDDYDTFEGYVRGKYKKEMAELDSQYAQNRVPSQQPELVEQEDDNMIVDQFGNKRPRTVFDPI
jgi:hypothetical protein